MIFGNVKDSFEGKRNIRGEVHLVLVLLSTISEVLEKLLIFFLSDLALSSGPDRFNEIDYLVVDHDGEIDEIGVFLNNLLDGGFL